MLVPSTSMGRRATRTFSLVKRGITSWWSIELVNTTVRDHEVPSAREHPRQSREYSTPEKALATYDRAVAQRVAKGFVELSGPALAAHRACDARRNERQRECLVMLTSAYAAIAERAQSLPAGELAVTVARVSVGPPEATILIALERLDDTLAGLRARATYDAALARELLVRPRHAAPEGRGVRALCEFEGAFQLVWIDLG